MSTPEAAGQRRPWVRLEGADWRRSRPKMPDAVGADLERRAAWRAARAAGRYARRAQRTAGWWVGLGALTALFGLAFDPSDWLAWLGTGAGALLGGGVWAAEAARFRRDHPAPPLPTAPAPSVRALTGSAAAGPLRRGEAAITAFLALARPLPPGQTADAIRAATVSAAQIVDGLRLRAERVIACEAAVKAVTDPVGRAQVTGTARALIDEMDAGARAVEDLVAAAAEVVGAGLVTGDYRPPVELDGLAAQAERLRGYAAGLRELAGPR